MAHYSRITVVGAALLIAAAGASTGVRASEAEKTTYLTFSRSVAIPGAELAPGTYIFEVATPSTSAGGVRVSSRDRSKVYLTALARNIERPAGLTAKGLVLLGEASRGEATPVRAWFPEGERQGYEFVYGNQ